MVDGMNRGVEAIERIVRRLLGYYSAGPVDYLALYPGRVVSQSGSKVDVQLDTDRIPSPSNVPLRLGVPGATANLNVAGGVRVLVGWDGGDPQKPYAHLFDQSAATLELNLAATTKIVINSIDVACGPVGTLPVLVQTLAFDSMGVPVSQAGCTNALKAG